MVQPILPQMDAYAFAQAMAGLEVTVTPSPATAALLMAFNPKQPDQWQQLQRVLSDGGLMAQVLAVDPKCPPPEPEQKQPAALDTMPDLPRAARLTPAQERIASEVGTWIDDYVKWAGAAANQTPLMFHQAGALFLGAMAIGRRLYVPTPWEQDVYPNLYIMTLAVSTYYRKTAAMNLVDKLGKSVMMHMIMPNPGSPEVFQTMLSGALPSNYENQPPHEKELMLKGQKYAAQRAILRDELSGLFKSLARDYMAGMKELIMRLYDAPDYMDFVTQSRGMIIVRNAALSIFGASTPAELAVSITSGDWHNGNLARFALLTPEPDYRERPRPADRKPPVALTHRLKHLYERLPEPPSPDFNGNKPDAEVWALVSPIWDQVDAYQAALRDMTAPGSELDDRLRTVYGRMHVQAIKIAIILAALDWADQSAEPRPTVTLAHWYRAQMIAESWRASAHRALSELGASEDERHEKRVLQAIQKSPKGVTIREIYRHLHLPRKTVADIIHSLEEDAVIEKLLSENGGQGRRADVYRFRSNGTSHVTDVTL